MGHSPVRSSHHDRSPMLKHSGHDGPCSYLPGRHTLSAGAPGIRQEVEGDQEPREGAVAVAQRNDAAQRQTAAARGQARGDRPCGGACWPTAQPILDRGLDELSELAHVQHDSAGGGCIPLMARGRRACLHTTQPSIKAVGAR